MPEHTSTLRIVGIHLLAVFLVMLNISNIEISGLSRVVPLFDVMAVFYFAIFRNLFAIWFVFLLGVWSDALTGDPLGLTALCYILLIEFFLTLNDNMMIRENFLQIWKQFMAFLFLFLLMKWSILSIFNHAAYSVITPFLQLALSGLIYALMHKLFDYLSGEIFEGD